VLTKANLRSKYLLSHFSLFVQSFEHFFTGRHDSNNPLSGAIESVLTQCISVWYGNSSNQDCKALQRVVRLAERISWSAFPSLQDIYLKRCKSRAAKIIKYSTHPGNHLFCLLPSGKRFRSMMAKKRFLHILLFFAHLIVFCTSYCFLHILLFCTSYCFALFISLHILLLFLFFYHIYALVLCYFI